MGRGSTIFTQRRKAPSGGTPLPTSTGLPVVSGSAQVGQTLTTTNGTWANSPILSYSYQWQRSTTGTGNWVTISGATTAAYVLQSADLNNYIRAGVRAANVTGAALSFAYSATTALVTTLSNGAWLQQQVANATNGATITVPDGTYTLDATLYVNATNLTIRSQSGNRGAVIIEGDAMSSSAVVGSVIQVNAAGFTVQDVTLRKCRWHLVQVKGELNADNVTIRNCVLQDSYQQMVKVTTDPVNPGVSGDNGLVEDCLFEYTAGVGPQYYIGGIDCHVGSNWIVRRNTFKNIASPASTLAEHAVHFWGGASGTLVERNTIIDCDRGIGFGLSGSSHTGGIIRNNMIHHTVRADHPYSDVQISLENAANASVYNNTVFMQNTYPNAIEYRFAGTTPGFISNNLTNKAIAQRDGGTSTLSNNVTNAQASWFRLSTTGDLKLASSVASVVDAGVAIAGLTNDHEGQARSGAVDIGADEYVAVTNPLTLPLMQKSNHVYLGAFNVPAGNATEMRSFNYGGQCIAFNPAGNGGAGSLFLTGHNAPNDTADWNIHIGEISIPAPKTSAYNTAAMLGPGNTVPSTLGASDVGGTNSLLVTGMLVQGAYLYINLQRFYDGAVQQTTSLHRRSTSLSSSTVGNPVRITSAYTVHYTNQYMEHVPANWQAIFSGKPHLVGGSAGVSAIASAQSNGPAVFGFNAADWGVTTPIPTVRGLVYPYSADGSQALGNLPTTQNDMWNTASAIRSVVLTADYRTLLVIGRHGTGTWTNSPNVTAAPYHNRIWAFDMQDIANVLSGANAAPWDVLPYATWNLSSDIPYAGGDHGTGICGCYDHVNKRLYLSQPYGNGTLPRIHVYQVN